MAAIVPKLLSVIDEGTISLKSKFQHYISFNCSDIDFLKVQHGRNSFKIGPRNIP